jgi:hypothetical protein
MTKKNVEKRWSDVFISGVAAEWATKLILHPFDTLKTRLQYLVIPKEQRGKARLPIIGDLFHLSNALHGELARLHPSIVGANLDGGRSWTRAVSTLQGFRSLFAGLTPTMIGVIPVAVVYMPTYEYTKSKLHGTVFQGTPLPGMLTGFASAMVRVPISVVKSQLQLRLHHNAMAVVKSVTGEGRGWRGLYVGLHATIFLDCSYAVVQFASLEQFRLLGLQYHQWLLRDASIEMKSLAPQDASQLSTGMNAAIGFATGVVTSIVTEPIDVIRTRLMGQRSQVPIHTLPCSPIRRYFNRSWSHDGPTPPSLPPNDPFLVSFCLPQAGGSSSAPGPAGAVARGPSLATNFGYSGFLDGVRRARQAEGVFALWQGLLPRMITKASGSTIWYTTYMEVREYLSSRRPDAPGVS